MSNLVSIVIPTYNAGHYLRESIDSILSQTYPNIELIVLDDGSTDGTRNILDSYGDLFYWETHENMGQSATLNKGWDISKGDILSYVSADDALFPDAVKTAVSFLTERPELVMVYGDYTLIDDTSLQLRVVHTPEFNYEKMVSELVVQPGPGVFFRRDAYKQAGGWNTSLYQMPDIEYWLKLGLCGDIARIPRNLAYYRVHNESQTYAIQSVEKANESVKIINDYFHNNNLPHEIAKLEKKSISMAHIIAARSHIKAGRYKLAWQHIIYAKRSYPKSLYSLRTIKLLGNGIKFRFNLLFSDNFESFYKNNK
jgi:glycosyltransferase involved in cell wall biosynthesis